MRAEGLPGAIRQELSAGQLEQLGLVLRALQADEHAPTAVRDPERAVKVHVNDSLTALELEPVRCARQIADIGSGAGFPGIALAVALPTAEIVLIESQRRRCEFLRRVCAHAGIGNARVICTRAEEWREGLNANDAVVARALGPVPVVLEYAAPLLRVGGSLVDWRGAPGRREEEEAAARAAAELGLRRVEVRRVEPFAGAREHHLHVYRKLRETPARFPRRAGIARKRPLGG
jgi:16S rRNA (guanine527-N7)-methyltransferase